MPDTLLEPSGAASRAGTGAWPDRLRSLMVRGLLASLLVAVLGAFFSQPASAAPDVPSAASTSGSVAAAAEDEPRPVELVYFRGEGCPNCEKLEEWWEDELFVEFPNVTVVDYEIWNDAANRDVFARLGEELDFPATATPTVILGERVWIGYSSAVTNDMRASIAAASRGEAVQGGLYGSPQAGACDSETLQCTAAGSGTTIDVPLFGQIDLGEHSLLFSTLVIGFVDGINPCSLWVITVLLTIVIRTGSRRRVIAIGSTFLVVTAAMYALFMAGIYSVLGLMGHLVQIQLAVAAIAGVFGLFALKDYFAFKKGPSLSISDSAKPGLYKRMRDLAGTKALLPALGATVVLAVLVSLLETPCTAGLPVLWTGMLQQAGVDGATAVLYFIVYMIPFLIDEFVVFAIAVVTMRATRMQEKHGQLLKLVAGVTMLTLAGAMVIAPGVMENPLAMLALFVGAFVAAAAIHALTTRIRAGRQSPPAQHEQRPDDDRQDATTPR